MNSPDERPHALRSGEAAATAWAETVEHQQQAQPRRADFYALAGEVVATLYALDDLTVVLVAQVGGYGHHRGVYDDTRTVDPATRLADAVQCLNGVRAGLGSAADAANAFWSAIGHIGVEESP